MLGTLLSTGNTMIDQTDLEAVPVSYRYIPCLPCCFCTVLSMK